MRDTRAVSWPASWSVCLPFLLGFCSEISSGSRSENMPLGIPRNTLRGPAGVDGGRPRRGLGGGGGVGDDVREGRARALQSGGYTMVVVMYVQETWYLIDDPNSEPDEDFVLVPLSTETGQVRGEAQVPERLRVPHRRFGNTIFAPD